MIIKYVGPTVDENGVKREALFDKEKEVALKTAAKVAIGVYYVIKTQKSVDFTKIGASSNKPGTVFYAKAGATLGAGDELGKLDFTKSSVSTSVSEPAKQVVDIL